MPRLPATCPRGGLRRIVIPRETHILDNGNKHRLLRTSVDISRRRRTNISTQTKPCHVLNIRESMSNSLHLSLRMGTTIITKIPPHLHQVQTYLLDITWELMDDCGRTAAGRMSFWISLGFLLLSHTGSWEFDLVCHFSAFSGDFLVDLQHKSTVHLIDTLCVS